MLDGDPRSRIRNVLVARGHRVITTRDARDALDCARERRAELLIVDLDLGVMDIIPRWEQRRTDSPAAGVEPPKDGYAVLRGLGTQPDSARFAAVFVKERNAPFDRSLAHRFAAVDFVGRPLTAPGLLAAVERALPPGRGEGPGAARWASGEWPRPSGPRTGPPPFAALPRPLLKALVVDGDDAYRRFLRGLLEPHGFEVHEAPNGREGIGRALSRRPWLILTDVNMPGMDGFDLCRRVRGHDLLHHTPLVFLSAWDDYGERYLGLKLGANDYLSKRMPARELLIRLELVLKRYAEVESSGSRAPGMEGRIELVGAAHMLQTCHLGRFSGACIVHAGMLRVEIRFREGEITGAESATARGAQAVYEVLASACGHFDLVPGDPGPGSPLAESFDYLLLEGCRRLDEQRRDS